MQQLREIQPRLHVHPSLFANPSLCARTHRLPSSTPWTEWPRTRGSRCAACPVRRSRAASAPSAAATGTRDHPTAASRDVLSKRTTPHGRCPAAPCVHNARSGKVVILPKRETELIVFNAQRHRRGSNSGFEYPDPTNLAPVTPAGSAPGYQTHTTPSPYAYPPPPVHDRRTSPPSAYSYDARTSSSPHGSPFPPMQSHPAPMTPSQGSVPPVSVQPGSAPIKTSGTPQPGGLTPPPTSTPGGSQRGGLNVRDMLNPGDSQGRSSTDSDMLNALNRRGPQ